MSDEAMKKALDQMIQENAATEPAPEPVVLAEPVPEEVDPLAHLIGQGNDCEQVDPFTAMLDSLLAQENMSKNDEITTKKQPDSEPHEWEFKKTTVFEDDLCEVICKKCYRSMKMDRLESFTEAQTKHQVNPDCSLDVMTGVMAT